MINHEAARDLALSTFIDCVHQIWTNSGTIYMFSVFFFFNMAEKLIGWNWAGPYAFDSGISKL